MNLRFVGTGVEKRLDWVIFLLNMIVTALHQIDIGWVGLFRGSKSLVDILHKMGYLDTQSRS